MMSESELAARLMRAVDADDGDAIQRMVAEDRADPNAYDSMNDTTPLLDAAGGGRLTAIRALMAADAFVDMTNGGGWTPLMYAAISGRTAAVDLLISYAASLDRVNGFGDTALHVASCFGRLEAVQSLLKAGATPDLPNERGKRPVDVVREPPVADVLARRFPDGVCASAWVHASCCFPSSHSRCHQATPRACTQPCQGPLSQHPPVAAHASTRCLHAVQSPACASPSPTAWVRDRRRATLPRTSRRAPPFARC
jgi:hypothetical protein